MPTSFSPARLYIGFGGSGAKTIAEFVENIVKHAEWGEQSETHFAILLVDTDRNDLTKFIQRIHERCSMIARQPIIESIRTSDGVANFQHYAAARLQGVSGSPRVQDAWWFRKAEGDTRIPFTASRLASSPEDGAGQCPLVSTFLAWNNLPAIEERIRKIVSDLERRLTLGADNQNWTLHTTIVSGLAGGTGRGCWHLLATKVREVLASIGRHTTPVGYFFDATVFQEVMNRDEGQANKMRINALTGFSELVAWMRNEKADPPYYFRIPNIDRPQDEAADLINVKRIVSTAAGQTLRDVSGHSPVNQAFVVFGGGRAGQPGSPENYYSIVANAMYARLVREIASQTANTAAFGGLGAASIAVPIEDIRAYVATYVKMHLPRSFAKPASPAVVDEWTKLLTDGLKTPDSFNYQSIESGSLCEKILHGVKASRDAILNNLSESIERKAYKRVESDCARIHDWPDSADGTRAIGDIAKRVLVETFWGRQADHTAPATGGLLRDLGLAVVLDEQRFAAVFGGKDTKLERVNPVAEALREILMRDKLSMPLPDGTRKEIDISSFAAKATLADKLAKRIQDLAEQLRGRPQSADPSAPGSRSPKDEFASARKGILSSGITPDEAQAINDTAWDWLRIRSMKAVQETLKPVLNQAADQLKSFAGALGEVVTALTTEADDTARSLDASRKRLFWGKEDYIATLECPADSLFAPGLLAEHRLQPVANDEALGRELDRLMGDPGNGRFSAEHLDFVGRITQWIREASGTALAAERSRDLRRTIEQGVAKMATNLVVPRRFYVDHFGFFAVVRDNVQDWGKELARRSGEEQVVTKLLTRFRVLFGRDYPRDKKDGVAIQFTGDELTHFAEDVCRSMAITLGNRCDVLFQYRQDQKVQRQDDVVAVVLPAEERFNAEFKDRAEKEVIEQGLFSRPGSFSVFPTFGQAAGSNPFLMLAYAQANFPNWTASDEKGLDLVSSLSYFQNRDTIRWLEACEDTEGRSVFTYDNSELPEAQESFGLGFTSPAFVRDEQLRQLRWRPWSRQSEGLATTRKTMALDAIAFAVLDEPPTDESLGLTSVNETEHWTMPLVNFHESAAPGEKAFEFARAAYRNDMGQRVANHPAFKAGDGYSSVAKFAQALELDPALADVVADEAVMYLEGVLPKHDEIISADDALTMLWQHLRRRLEKAKETASGPQRDAFRRLYDELIARVQYLESLKHAGLLDHYKRRGRG